MTPALTPAPWPPCVPVVALVIGATITLVAIITNVVFRAPGWVGGWEVLGWGGQYGRNSGTHLCAWNAIEALWVTNPAEAI